MNQFAYRRWILKILVRTACFFIAFSLLPAGEPILKVYTSNDGLGHDRVRRIVTDSHDLLWFCTSGGLSRFDGSRLLNIGLEQGLPTASINDLLEADNGDFWIASNGGGLLKLAASTELEAASNGIKKRHFQVFLLDGGPASNRINVLFRDRSGFLWLGTDGGLFQGHEIKGKFSVKRMGLHLPGYPDPTLQIWAIIDDSKGGLWLGTRGGLVHLLFDGRRIHYPVQPLRSTDDVNALSRDPDGLLWIGHQAGLILFRPDNPQGTESHVLQRAVEHGSSDLGMLHSLPVGQALFHLPGASLAAGGVSAIRASANGHKWIGTTRSGLYEFDGKLVRPIMRHTAFSDATISALVEDRDANLWVGTATLGVGRILRNGIVRFDDLQSSVQAILQNREGAIVVSSIPWKLSRFNGQRFVTNSLRFRAGDLGASWGGIQCILQDHSGDWWVASRIGLLRFSRERYPELLATAQPKAVYTRSEGLADNDVRHLLEDSRGDIWISNFTGGRPSLTRWERATGKFRQYSEVDGLPSSNTPNLLLEDSKGVVWIGLRDGGIARYENGRFHLYTEAEGVPSGEIRACTIDHSDQLWCGIGLHGLVRLRFPEQGSAIATCYSKRQGLTSNVVTAIGEDSAGRIYAGTPQGIDQLNIDNGQIRHLTSADGLPAGEVIQIMRDRTGDLWIGTLHGICRLNPEFLTSNHRTRIFISGLRISGIPYLLPITGAQEVIVPDLPEQHNSLEIDYMQAYYGPGDEPLCRYKLEEAENSWSEPTAIDSIHFSNLGPGSYRFGVKALNHDGSESAPATVKFRILPPVWRRAWFICLVLGLGITGLLLFVRYRTLQIRKIRHSEERFRTLAETAYDAIVTIDEEHCVTFANASAENMFGYKLSEVLGQPLTRLVPGLLLNQRQTPEVKNPQKCSQLSARKPVEAVGLHRDGREIPLELSSGEFTHDHQSFYTVVIRDITSRKQAEEALRRSQNDRLAELERVRRRIATDLHDDIGSSLTQISIMSEVLQQKIKDSALSSPLANIAGVSRELIDSMSDIVWAINPHRDHLSDLVSRMRRFAVDTLSVRNIKYALHFSSYELRLEGTLRRELFLVFKEGINNIVRHSGCSAVMVALTIENGHLRLLLQDNGKGFDIDTRSEGYGLASMRQRAAEIGAELVLRSCLGEGTTITLDMPLTKEMCNTLDERFTC
jgi:PAS domain S-box-containing protein